MRAEGHWSRRSEERREQREARRRLLAAANRDTRERNAQAEEQLIAELAASHGHSIEEERKGLRDHAKFLQQQTAAATAVQPKAQPQQLQQQCAPFAC